MQFSVAVDLPRQQHLVRPRAVVVLGQPRLGFGKLSEDIDIDADRLSEHRESLGHSVGGRRIRYDGNAAEAAIEELTHLSRDLGELEDRDIWLGVAGVVKCAKSWNERGISEQ